MNKRTELLFSLLVLAISIFLGWRNADAWTSPVKLPTDVCEVYRFAGASYARRFGSILACKTGGKNKNWINSDGEIGVNVDGTSTDSKDFILNVVAELWTDVDGDGLADAGDTSSTWVNKFTHTLSGAGLQQIQINQSISDGTIRLSTQSTLDIRIGNATLGFTEYNLTGLAGFYLIRFVLTNTYTDDNSYKNVWPYATSGSSAYMNGDGFAVDSDGKVTSERVMSDGSIINFRVNRKPS